MRTTLLAGALLSALFLTACGADEPVAIGVSTGESERPTPTLPDPDPGQLYEADGTVLEQGDGTGSPAHGPELCLGGMLLTSLPPQCGGVPLANWDWAAVEGEESAAGTTWGAYHVVGTYDGEVFTVSRVGAAGSERYDDTYRYENPCPEPEGGWVVPDPKHNTQEDVGAARAYATKQADYVISWVDHLVEPSADSVDENGLEEFGPVVFVAVFTGDAESHEAEIRKLWNGPLCVVARDVPTERELQGIREEVEARLPELGLEFLGSGTGGSEPTIFIDVVVDVDGRAQALVDEEYGPGIVRFVPALRPVEQVVSGGRPAAGSVPWSLTKRERRGAGFPAPRVGCLGVGRRYWAAQ